MMTRRKFLGLAAAAASVSPAPAHQVPRLMTRSEFSRWRLAYWDLARPPKGWEAAMDRQYATYVQSRSRFRNFPR